MRLDKYLASQTQESRSQVKEFIRRKLVNVDEQIITNPEFQVDPEKNKVKLRGNVIGYSQYQYFLLNKPAGVISATKDRLSETVLGLLPKDHKKDLFPVGRLDKDTEGLLLITNDGALAHSLLSPKKHVSKTYLVKIKKELTDEDIARLEQGVDIGEVTLTLPASVTKIYDPNLEGEWIHLTIHEGRFHQVKRMLQAVENEVLYLKRIRFGGLSLDSSLKPGDCRELTGEELQLLKRSREVAEEKRKLLQGKKAVIFDLDGSLIDSMWIWGRIDEEYLGRFGIQLKSREELRSKIEGMSFYETAVFFKEYFQLPDSIEKMTSDWNQMAWDKYEKEVPLKAGIPDFLEGCRRNGLKLGIATSNSRELVDNVLSVHRVSNQFESIITGSEITKGKPAPDVYLAVAKALGVSPEDCLVFEDIVKGIMAGKNAGMTTCAVADEDSAATWENKKEIADYAIYDFYDFFGSVDK